MLTHHQKTFGSPALDSLHTEALTLCIDTAGPACQAVVARGVHILSAQSEAMTRGHGEVLVPMVERALADAGHAYEDLDRIGVTIGPGSFTGLRVGLAAARGFSATLNIDVVGVGSLAALAWSDREDLPNPAAQAVALDARNGLVYGQRFDATGNPVEDPDVMADLVFAASVSDGMRLVGPMQKVLAAVCSSAGKQVVLGEAGAVPTPQALAALTLEGNPRVRAQPLYLKAADAKPQKSAGLRAESP
ncbi:MAG: tRNA (adenosine(37)-N6)-threonylcarbamoyltransferase complex dimerization subunit type 1 TsaB [Devosiaceae bacterium]|nr:tRNA (adenosine(37)-N6)-threonylcarbamoyltransferase complex dimerization subunit type 1 TsaB [Devosiaceae bacterium MH13]